MKVFIRTIIILCFFSLAIFSSCKKSEDATNPVISTPQEQITTVILSGYNHHHPSDSNFFIQCKWEDLDGNGGNAPTIDSLVLDTGITYDVRLLLLDKTKAPYDTVSNEVAELGNMHQLFYTPSATLQHKIGIDRLDLDGNNPALPVGLQTQWKVVSQQSYPLPVTGSLNLVLSHYDGIPKTTQPSPESDIDVTFPVRLR
ncbi:MAG: hypothetical protein V4590_10475 [Bacteroidota bacterium]